VIIKHAIHLCCWKSMCLFPILLATLVTLQASCHLSPAIYPLPLVTSHAPNRTAPEPALEVLSPCCCLPLTLACILSLAAQLTLSSKAPSLVESPSAASSSLCVILPGACWLSYATLFHLNRISAPLPVSWTQQLTRNSRCSYKYNSIYRIEYLNSSNW
jgi:hypothetical protein